MRLEYSSGSSNKFWSIVVDGNSHTVRWGKQGTTGREQTKTFADPVVAQADADKKIAAKIKKGYAEAAREPHAAASAKAEPSPVAIHEPETTGKTTAAPAQMTPSPLEEDVLPLDPQMDYSINTLVWTEKLRERVLPQRGDPRPKRRRTKLKASSVYKKGREALEKFPERFVQRLDPVGFDHKKHDRLVANQPAIDMMAKVRIRLVGQEPESFDAQLEAASMVLNAHFHDWGQPQVQAVTRGFRLCHQNFGLRAAAEALALTLSTGLVQLHSRSSRRFYFKLDAGPTWGSAAAFQPWEALREALAFASDQDYDETKKWLLAWQARPVGTPAGDNTLAQVRAQFVLPSEFDPPDVLLTNVHAAPLLACARTVEQAKKLIKGPYVARYFPTLVHNLGLEAMPLLIEYKRTNGDADEVRETVRALTVFVGDEPAKVLLESVGAKSTRALIGDYFVRYPELGLRVLPAFIKDQRTKVPREAAKAILSSCESALSAGAAKNDNAPQATDSDLPSAVLSPPWRQKRKKTKEPVFDLARMVIPPVLELTDDEKKRSAKVGDISNGPHADEARAIKQLDNAVAGISWGSTYYLCGLADDERVFDYIRTIPKWGWVEAPEMLGLIVRVGPRIAPYLPKLAGDEVERILGASDFGTVHIASAMAAIQLRTKGKIGARRWLSRFPEHASVGLIPDLLGSDKKAKKAAKAALRYLISHGAAETVRSAGERYGAEASTAVSAFVDLDPLLVTPPKAPKLPAWFDVTRLPRLVLKVGGTLDDTRASYVVEMLVFSPSDPCYAGLLQIKESCTQASCDAFVQALCTAWVTGGAKPSGSWAAVAVGHLGGDDSARWLVRQIDVWANDGGRSRAIFGLEALAMIGSDVALMPLGRWSRRGRPWLKTAATEILATVAEARGLSRDELDDRTAPTLGLDDGGKRMLDYGPRKFFVRFDERLVPSIWDESGQRMAKIPPVRKTDDKSKGTAAKKQWAALKKDAERLAQGQIDRLERAMTLERRWSAAEFKQYIAGHPLVGHLARRLIFGVFEAGKLVDSFRAEEEGSFANREDDPLVLGESSVVGVVHPLHLDSATLAAWGEVLSDYELLQPFPQIGRKVFTIENAERTTNVLNRFKGMQAYTGRLFALRNRGWSFDGDPYSVDRATKTLRNGQAVWLSWNPGFERDRPKMEEHALGPLRIYGSEQTFGKLGPIAFSELMVDLESLRG